MHRKAVVAIGLGLFFEPLTCGFLVELRGLEPLTPTLPG
jgi:hypothetical protein